MADLAQDLDDPEDPSPARPSPARPGLRNQALQAAAVLLLAQRRNQSGLHAALQLPSNLITLGASPATVQQSIRLTSVTAVERLRGGTKIASANAWQRFAGLAKSPLAIAPRAELVRADRAAMGIAQSWSHRFIEAREDLDVRPAMREAFTRIGYVLDRTSATETVHAYSEETQRQNDYAHATGYVVEESWSAFLDACPECAELDGDFALLPDRLLQTPPLHPNCQCLLVSFVR